MKMRTANFLIIMLAMSCAMALEVRAGGVDRLQEGYELTESFSSDLGGDAEAFYRITSYSAKGIGIAYSSTLGTVAIREVRADDRVKSNTFMLGFATSMPQRLPGSTSLGISADTLVLLRENGSVPIILVHNSRMETIGGVLTSKGEVKFPIIIDNKVVELNGIRARGVFQNGAYAGEGEFIFFNNRNNPLVLEYSIKFNWEHNPRVLKITRLVAGPSQISEMEQALSTFGKLELYGIHFDFGKASIQANTNQLLEQIAKMLKNNSGWTLAVEGHTDSIGGEAVNQALSLRRAQSVISALVNRYGIKRNRLTAVGHGMSEPKASNDTLEGRALNRRVELVRTDT